MVTDPAGTSKPVRSQLRRCLPSGHSGVDRGGGTGEPAVTTVSTDLHGLLRHLQAAGFPAPCPLGTEDNPDLLT